MGGLPSAALVAGLNIKIKKHLGTKLIVFGSVLFINDVRSPLMVELFDYIY